MANVWMHNGHLQVEGQKMSKSLGNFVTIHELLRSQRFGGQLWDGDTIRLAMLKTHYSQPLDWTVDLLEEARKNIEKLSIRYRFASTTPSSRFMEFMTDDLHTKLAIDTVLDLAGQASDGNFEAGGQLAASLDLLGLLADGNLSTWPGYELDEHGKPVIDSEEEFFAQMLDAVPRNMPTGVFKYKIIPQLQDLKPILDKKMRYASDTVPVGFIFLKPALVEEANTSIEARSSARTAKKYAEADHIRNQLSAAGITLEDRKDPVTGQIKTEWKPAR
jgi:cysteinyl-tRNA synthetase